MTVFTRRSEFKMAPGLDFPRVVGALLHLIIIPFLNYQVMYNDLGAGLLSSWTSVNPLSDDRKALYMFLCAFYAVRWAVGMIVMMGSVDLRTAVVVAVIHIFLHELPYVVFSMGFWGATTDLTARDYVAAGLMVLAGVLQHGSELQRWFFKRDPGNRGRIHTSGLFALARGINHTGHILRDLASCLFAPNPVLLLYLLGAYDLVFRIVPETVDHMRKKYGEAYEKYEKATPALFIPGVY